MNEIILVLYVDKSKPKAEIDAMKNVFMSSCESNKHIAFVIPGAKQTKVECINPVMLSKRKHKEVRKLLSDLKESIKAK
jgi:hypothetical protein